MARKPGGGERVHGPYKHKDKWRIVIVRGSGRHREQTYQSFTTKEEARRVKNSVARQLSSSKVTVGAALEKYEHYQLHTKGNRKSSTATTMTRLRSFFTDEDEILERITPLRGETLYTELIQKQVIAKKSPAKDGAVDTHRNTLAEAKTFCNWCCGKKRRWLAKTPLEDVEGVGRRSEGKKQPRIDEARLWLDEAVEAADDGEEGAVMAMVSLLMSVRSTPIVISVVRDLDDNGTLLWIDHDKTGAGRRRVKVPSVLQPYLRDLATGKKPEDLLFGHHDYGYVCEWVKRICRRAGVPEVTAHGMRGAHGTFAEASGETAAAVARTLGHESPRTTHKHYTKPEAVAGAKQDRVLKVLAGGKK